MAGRHAEPHRDGADNDVAGAPEGSHGGYVGAEVMGVLCDAVAHPVDRIRTGTLHELLDRVEDGEVDAGEEDADVEGDLLKGSEGARAIAELLGEGGVGEAVHAREPLAVLRDEDPPLEAP